MGRFLPIIGHSKTSLTTVLFQQYVSRAASLFFCFTFFLFVVFFFVFFVSMLLSLLYMADPHLPCLFFVFVLCTI